MSQISPEELYELYHKEGLSQREIGERFDVSQSAVSKWMNKYDIKSRAPSKWSEKEKKLLKDNYPGDKSKISSLFPERSWNAIKLKAMDLDLARDQEEYRRSEEVAKNCRRLSRQNEIEVDFSNKKALSYVLGVIDGDGYHDNSGTIGLEVKDELFANKFIERLEELGLNPNKGEKRGKTSVWASSQVLVNWLMDLDEKLDWLKKEGDPWKYIEGQYDSDGNLHPSGSPRICSYDEEEKLFVQKLFEYLGIEANIQQNNVWVTKPSSEKFFGNIDPVLERRKL